jgi:hypothetical protein
MTCDGRWRGAGTLDQEVVVEKDRRRKRKKVLFVLE